MEIMLGNFVDGGEAQLPPGFRFHPTDEELITYYLMKKVIDSGFTGRAIAEVDLNKCEPWELPGTYTCTSEHQQEYKGLIFAAYEINVSVVFAMPCSESQDGRERVVLFQSERSEVPNRA